MEKYSKVYRLISIFALMLYLGFSKPAYGSTDDLTPDQYTVKKASYLFHTRDTLKGVAECQCVIYPYSDRNVMACKGDVMYRPNGSIVDVKFNPSSYNFIVIYNKKGINKAVAVTSDLNLDNRYNFDNKKVGEPMAVTYLPNGRGVLIAVPGNIKQYDVLKFQPTDTFATDMSPKAITVSNNLNYLAMTDGSRVKVLNFDTKKVRFDRIIEGTVSAIAFNKDATQFAVLTDDGSLQIFNTRNFTIQQTIDDLDGGLDFDYNLDGKYVALASSPHVIEIINLLKPADRDSIKVNDKAISDIAFIPDTNGEQLLTWSADKDVMIRRMRNLDPYYGKLIREEADDKLNEWLKMMPGETLEGYNQRVTDESRRDMLSRYEQESATRYANGLVSMSTITLGGYNPENETLEVRFSNMPSIFLNVPEGNLQAFDDVESLEFGNAVYGVNEDDSFDLIYTEVYNRKDGLTYIYDNLKRNILNYMNSDDAAISLEVIRQQKIEEVKLQEIKQQVIEEAKQENLISDHTYITVDSRIVPDYDADGNRILNYDVKFSYTVDPEYTLIEDYGPGKYKITESGAASAMMDIVRKALEGDLAKYVMEGKKLKVILSGSADATPINRPIKYDGCYGEYDGEPVREAGKLTNISVNRRNGLADNSQLAFVRALGVKDFIENNIANIGKMNKDYDYEIIVSTDKGSQYRRITAELIFINAF